MRDGGSIVRRRVLEVLIIAALVMWAMQLLLGQWAHGQAMPPQMGEERFVPGPAWSGAANVELKTEAKLEGTEARLKQIVRWGDVDKAMMDQAGELVVARMERGQRVAAVGLQQIKETLEGAGVNLAMMRFSGAAECKVTWGEGKGQSADLRSQISDLKSQISDSKLQSADFRSQSADIRKLQPLTLPSPRSTGARVSEEFRGEGTRTLREVLLADLVERLNLPAEAFVVRFSPQDERLAALSEPLYRFEAQCRNPRSIGDVTWDVTIMSDTGRQKTAVNATVGIWQTQLVAARPVGIAQVFSADDVREKRIVVDQLREGIPLAKDQVVGQQSSQDIGAGMVIVPRMVEPVQVVKTGQKVTVTVEYGSVQITWVGEARESGTLGQTIRVRKILGETRDEFNVTLTGPQEGRLMGGTKVAVK
jgi:flagella basal body P-ring formation protein FlgA